MAQFMYWYSLLFDLIILIRMELWENDICQTSRRPSGSGHYDLSVCRRLSLTTKPPTCDTVDG